jgi:hypothetical protein
MLPLRPADVAGYNSFKPDDPGRIFSTYKTALHENSENGNMKTPCCKNLKTCVYFVYFSKRNYLNKFLTWPTLCVKI